MAGRLIGFGLLAVAAAAIGSACGDGDSDGSRPEAAAESTRSPERDAVSALQQGVASSTATVEVEVESSCPPPAVLACRPALRLVGRLRDQPAPRLRHDLAAAVPAALRRLGYRRIEVRQGRRGDELVGRAVSGSETLARWRTRERVLEIVTGGPRL